MRLAAGCCTKGGHAHRFIKCFGFSTLAGRIGTECLSVCLVLWFGFLGNNMLYSHKFSFSGVFLYLFYFTINRIEASSHHYLLPTDLTFNAVFLCFKSQMTMSLVRGKAQAT
jgi:hypothetical protein